jgi:protein involved in polysaccharide export with SLBB domain
MIWGMPLPPVLLLATALALSCVAGTAAQGDSVRAGADQAMSADPADALRPGDIVRLAVWREQAFSGDFTVDRDGRVVLPRLGMIDVRGVPTEELREQILTGLERYLRNPSIDVIFLRRITIHGAVARAGLYPVDPTMTVLDALALAGGARADGRMDRIQLIRDGQELATIPTTGVQMGDLEIRSGDQLFVPEQGWFRRNTPLVATALSAAVSVAITLLYISQ